MNYANGHVLIQGYDTAYRLQNQTVAAIYEMTYDFYDGNSNLTMRSDAQSYMTEYFNYDALNRLASASDDYNYRDYSYDKNGNRSQQSVNGQSTSYVYQTQSNRLSAIDAQPVTQDANGNTTTLHGMNLTYDAHNRLTDVLDRAQYRYNGLSQRTTKREIIQPSTGIGRLTRFAYGLNGELLVETGPTGQVKREYFYLNGVLSALQDRVPSSTEPFLRADFDGDGLITQQDYDEWHNLHYLGSPDPAYDVTGDGLNDDSDRAYLSDCVSTGSCLASAYATRLYFVHTDHLGTPKAMTDTAGVLVWSATHTPFGRASVNADPDGDGEPVQMQVRFPGQYEDRETGLHYNYYRYYDPQTGRYITSDPIGVLGLMEELGIYGFQTGDANTYLYGLNNPLYYIDIDGETREKYQKPENPNKRKGADKRKPGGQRERNVRHPNAEEHSRRPKGGSRIPRIPSIPLILCPLCEILDPSQWEPPPPPSC